MLAQQADQFRSEITTSCEEGKNRTMVDTKDTHKKCSTCFETLPFAEMMHTMMRGQGVGSLCAEMMAKIMKQQKDGCSFHDAELLRNMMEACNRDQEDPKQSQQEEFYGSKESESDVDEE